MRRHGLAFFSLAVKGRKVLLGRDAGLGKALKFCWGRDAGLGKPSPTQTGQRSGELIAKGGMQPIGYWMWYFARSGEPSRAASLSAGFPLC